MPTLTEFKRISSIKGVSEYLLVRNTGEIVIQSRRIRKTRRTAGAVLAMGGNIDAMSASRFTYLQVSIRERDSLFIFPVGNYYLGVINRDGTDGETLAERVMAFLEDLQKKTLPGPDQP